jgi:4-methoxybenzoate monooxygenase (O-demethylating)
VREAYPMLSTATVSLIDLFADDVLNAPYACFAELRDTGPAVWLERYGVWVCARYAEVHGSLRDWETFSSAAGTGIDDLHRSDSWRPPSLIAEVDPPMHTRHRAVMNRALSAKAMAGMREAFRASAETLAGELTARGRIDAVKDMAEAYPLSVFPKAVGLKAVGLKAVGLEAVGIGSDGLDHLRAYGDMVFNAIGPRNARVEASMAEAAKIVPWITARCARDALSKGSIGAAIWDCVDSGEITADVAPLLVRSLLSAGLATIAAIGNAIYAFATHPDAWQALRADPSLVRTTFDEVLRWESLVQMFFRTTTRAVDFGRVLVPEGAKVLMLTGSANRDPRKWEDPDRFDIRRSSVGHVAFGAGIHLCVGQMLARLELEMILTALISRVRHIEIASEPKRRLNNTLRQFDSLPVELRPA